MLPHAKSFRDPVVYQRAIALEENIFRLTRSFPMEERYALTDQIRRAARSIGAQIAEAWARRKYPAHFASKLSDADAEQMEAQHWVGSAMRAGYWTNEEADALLGAMNEIARMLGAMIRQAEQFCGHDDTLSEGSAAYCCLSPDDDRPLITDH